MGHQLPPKYLRQTQLSENMWPDSMGFVLGEYRANKHNQEERVRTGLFLAAKKRSSGDTSQSSTSPDK